MIKPRPRHQRDRSASVPVTPTKPKGLNINLMAEVETRAAPRLAGEMRDPFTIAAPMPGVLPKRNMRGGKVIGMDWNAQVGAVYAWAAQGAFQEGLGFMGYPYLAQLTQRAEYRRPSEIIALEMTRKWISVTSTGSASKAKISKMEEALDDFDVQALFRTNAEQDGFFGRSQLFVDVADQEEEWALPLPIDKRKVEKGQLKTFKVIEPYWSYPGMYNSDSPLKKDFYVPSTWYVNGDEVHKTRLMTFIGRPLPDILKPAYAFGGLSMSQMAKPYVDNWLRTRQSVSDLVHAFSVMVLSTDLSTILQEGGSASQLIRRAQLFTQTRDNRGLMMVNKDTEELSNIAVPLGSLDSLQAQSQEQMASVAGIPLVVLLGITPSGLNASSDGEIRTFYAKIKADQERVFRPNLKRVFDLIQLHVFGEVDKSLGFQFNPLWEETELDKATRRKTQSDTDTAYINAGVIDPEEAREVLAGDEDSPYYGLDLDKAITPPAPAPMPGEKDPDDEEDDDEPVGQDTMPFEELDDEPAAPAPEDDEPV